MTDATFKKGYQNLNPKKLVKICKYKKGHNKIGL